MYLDESARGAQRDHTMAASSPTNTNTNTDGSSNTTSGDSGTAEQPVLNGDDGQDEEVEVCELHVRGDATAVARAHSHISTALAEYADARVATVDVPEGRMGAVIGKGGAKVRELEAAFGVRIDTVPGYSSVTIMGAPAAITAASDEIRSLLEERFGGFGGGADERDALEVPDGKMRLVCAQDCYTRLAVFVFGFSLTRLPSPFLRLLVPVVLP